MHMHQTHSLYVCIYCQGRSTTLLVYLCGDLSGSPGKKEMRKRDRFSSCDDGGTASVFQIFAPEVQKKDEGREEEGRRQEGREDEGRGRRKKGNEYRDRSREIIMVNPTLF